ncbi:FG-GAP-like repeat-containing protein [Streptomyces sp. NPDC049687]|uniref:FG-GAP-like repeat-containing protein n=1 Tax=Streptomyces sp. NPDC049687 TaxID=3365596 RepID=UPI0037940B3C
MGRSAMSPRRRAAATALVTVSLVLAGTALPAAPAAAATVLPPWTSPVTLHTYKSELQDVVVTKDGTTVAVWTQNNTGYLYSATRPANSNTWSKQVAVADVVGEARLAARPDGSVAALWTTTSHVASATLGADRSAWSQPAVISTNESTAFEYPDLAVGPGGTLAAVWTQRVWRSGRSEAYAATLVGEGSWSTPAQVSNAATYAGVGYGTVGKPQIAYDGQGGLVVSYWMNVNTLSYRVMTNAKPADATAWPTPQEITASRELPTLASAPDGSVRLVYQDMNGTFQTMRRPDAATAWSEPQTAATAVGDPGDVPEPLVGPDGDITLVWFDRATGAENVKTTTYDSSTGAWSAPKILSHGVVQPSSDASVAPDGSVHVLWPELDADQQTTSLWEATLADGEWTSARRVGGGKSVRGEIVADAAGSATAVWGPASGVSADTEVFASRTAWPALTVTDRTVPAVVPLKGTTSSSAAWKPAWTTNSAVASWTLTLTDTAGRTVRTLSGAAPATGSTTLAPVWNGRTTTGAIAVNGRLTWTLKAVQWGSGTSSTLGTGTVTVTGGSPAFRDFGGHEVTPDGLGDLLHLDSTGRIEWALGDGTGQLETGAAATGWPTSIKAVPFGDLNGDRCNDVLVRVGDALRAYRPACGTAPKPSTTYKTISTTGWKQYDVLTYPGDVTKDGRPDLIARNASTGAVYLYKGTSTAGLSARVKLYDNWKTYKQVVGAGDLNGDGIGDLVAQDKANNLYRYYGKGDGTFSARAKIFAVWGSSYNAVVGVGDINRDGKADLLARDTAGNLYRQLGNGKGSYGSRVKIGGGYSRYKALF